MNRFFKPTILLALALSSSQVLALGLGQIRVKSTLNKPLVAEIPLRIDHRGEADRLSVSLASAEQLARVGLDRQGISVQLNFKIIVNKAGKRVIRVTSEAPVRESFLDFLIKVSWPRGQVLREYTVLLDPPGAAASLRLQGAVASVPSALQPSKPAMKAGAAVKRPATVKVPSSRKTASRSTPSAVAPRRQRTGKYGPVAAGQTLWHIASKVRGTGVSINQMMLALKSSNPDAFYKNNINALKRGAVLRIPSRDKVLTETIASATAKVVSENRGWHNAAAVKPTTVAATGQSHVSAPVAPKPSIAKGKSSGGKLKLVSPSNGGKNTSAHAGVANGSSKVTVEQLHQDMARTKEALSSAKQQTTDLEVRVKSLKSIQDKNEHLMSLKNVEIAELQNKLAEVGKPASSGSAAVAAMSGDVATSSSSAAAAISANQPASSASASQPASSASASQPASSASASASASQPASSASASASQPASSASASASQPASSASATLPVSGASVGKAASVSTSAPGRATSIGKPVKVPTTKPGSITKPVPARVTVQPWYATLWAKVAVAATVIVLLLLLLRRRNKKTATLSPADAADPFADLPIAGKQGDNLDQEKNDLLHELAEKPDDIGLHLELVSLYYGRHDVEHFESAAEAMHAHVSDPQQVEWQDVMMMGEKLSPDYPLFAGAVDACAQGGPESAATMPDTSASVAAESAAETEPVAPAADALISEYSYNFDLISAAEKPHSEASGEGDSDALPPVTEAPPAPEVGGDDVVQFEGGDHSDALPALAEVPSAHEAGGDDLVQFEDSSPTLVKPQPATEESAPTNVSSLDGDGDGGGLDLHVDEEPAVSDPGPDGDPGPDDSVIDIKIDLAKAYVDMGDHDGARAMLEEVLAEASDPQREIAQKLLDELN